MPSKEFLDFNERKDILSPLNITSSEKMIIDEMNGPGIFPHDALLPSLTVKLESNPESLNEGDGKGENFKIMEMMLV